MSLDRFWISESAKHVGKTVTLQGWVYHKRSSGKIKFLVLRDGSGIMQCVFVTGEADANAFESFEKLTQESAVRVTGTVRAEPRSSGGHELTARSLEVVSIAEPYPISPKEHGVEFLMENRHLWIRSHKQWANLRIRSQVIRSIHDFFHGQGFVHFDAPILTPSSCEGTSTLFSTEYFEQQAFLTQSGQLYGETGAMAFGKIYVFGPTFRAEKSKTRKHLTEFWMVEPEMAFADIHDAMTLGEGLVCAVVSDVLKKCAEELKILERPLETLQKIKGPFPRITYDEALAILEKRGVALPWGEDLGAPHEQALGDEFGVPVFLHHMPAQIKAFYFKHEGRTALGCDLIAPDGYGEIIGGGQREESVDVLKTRIAEHGLNEADYSWYLDLRRFGSVPHAGFGLGVERLVAWMTGAPHVRETIPYPRMIHTLRP